MAQNQQNTTYYVPIEMTSILTIEEPDEQATNLGGELRVKSQQERRKPEQMKGEEMGDLEAARAGETVQVSWLFIYPRGVFLLGMSRLICTYVSGWLILHRKVGEALINDSAGANGNNDMALLTCHPRPSPSSRSLPLQSSVHVLVVYFYEYMCAFVCSRWEYY